MNDVVTERIATVAGAYPEALRELVLRWFERFSESASNEDLPVEVIAPLVRVIACSDFAATTLIRERQWFIEHHPEFRNPPEKAALDRFAEMIASSDDSIDAIKRFLRQFRNRYMLHVVWREITGDATLDETLASLSRLADRLLDGAARYSQRKLMTRYGRVCDGAGEAVPIVILGMGKLGGGELNLSSDIDLIFLYSGGTESNGERRLSAQEYFTRLSRHVVALIDEKTADGFVFRIDTRLRPFGDSGPAVVSFAALESYLLQHGRNWERYAYIKASVVGPRPPAAIIDELFSSLINPFVYRRYLDFGVFESLRDMQALIATEVERRDLADNIKRGPGGIREIEFIVQSLQLVRGGSQPELQCRQLQEVLPRLVGHRGLDATAADQLRDAYRFLRRLENFLQALRDQQTHDLPSDDIDRLRLCLAMEYPDWTALSREVEKHRQIVASQFAAIAFRAADGGAENHLRQLFAEAWDHNASAERWHQLLESEHYSDANALARELHKFRNLPQTLQMDATATGRLQQFIPDLLIVCQSSDRPLAAVTRTLAIVEKILRRSAYLALLNENAVALGRLVELCERSTYIAEEIARYPVLLDELLDPRIYSVQISRDELEAELQQRFEHVDADDGEAQMELLAQFQRAQLFRVAVADFNANLPIMKVSDALTYLAETVLNQALRIAWNDVSRRHGVPQYELEDETREAGFGVIAYGKLGGLELSYGSDLDLVFLHDSHGEKRVTNGDRPLQNSVFFARLVRRVVHYLTTQTGSGILYEVDMRLRPDGRSGLLVTSIDAFEKYQDEHAWTWEHQALLRARPVAGSEQVAAEFTRIRAETLMNRVRRDVLREDVVSMRKRMRQELDRSDGSRFDLKQGEGGIGDIEFIVQYLVLRNARQHPDVIVYSDNIRQLDALAASGCIERETATRLQDVYRAFRLQVHRLMLDEREPLVANADFVAERAFVAGLWKSTLGDVDAA